MLNSFSTRTFFVLFEVIFLYKFFSFSSKYVLFTKLTRSLFLTKFAHFNLKAKMSAINLLNSGVIIYLS